MTLAAILILCAAARGGGVVATGLSSFEGIEEYPLGTPSWLARRKELEWSRKSLYGQLRRWFGIKDRTPDCTLVVSNTAVGEQIGLGREAVGDGLRELELLRLVHVEGPPKGVRYVFFHMHPWMQVPGAVPSWVNLPQVDQPVCANSGRPLASTSPSRESVLASVDTVDARIPCFGRIAPISLFTKLSKSAPPRRRNC